MTADDQFRSHSLPAVRRRAPRRSRSSRRRPLDQSLRHWATVFDNTRDGVLITDPQARIRCVNPAFSRITGYTAEDALGRTPGMLHSGRHGPDFYAALWRDLSAAGSWQGEVWNRHKNGDVYPQWLSISAVLDRAGLVSSYVGVFTDITRIKQGEARLEQLAHYDALTGLPNRSLLRQRLEQALEADRDGNTGNALLHIDLDGFNTVNDSLGHPAGDELLLCVAQRLRARVRHEDTLGRLGGDEFLVVMESVRGPDQAAVLARDLLQAMAKPIGLSSGRDAYVTASIGISLRPGGDGTSAVEMLRDADGAMHRAKVEGRNRFRFYTSDLHAQAVAKLDVEAALCRALERDEFLLHYQPQVDARTGRFVAAEALLRWRRGSSFVAPDQFIPVAERSSLILDIGNWVIDTACRQVRRWLDAGLPAPRIAVNVSARQFAAGDLDRVVGAALRRHSVPAACLEVELTEGMLVASVADTEAMLHRLKAIGVTLALDDFGTGYSSLGYLQRLPIDKLKIDKSFVGRIGTETNGSAIADAVIALAHRLQLRVVAEGVETSDQRDHLLQQGCDEFQGFLFSRPLTADSLAALLAHQQPLLQE